MNANEAAPIVDAETLAEMIETTRDYETYLVRRWREVKRLRAALSAMRDGTEDLNEAIWRGTAL